MNNESRITAMNQLVKNYQTRIDELRRANAANNEVQQAIDRSNHEIRQCSYDFKLSHWTYFVS
jgi:DNA repair ATPase RecN